MSHTNVDVIEHEKELEEFRQNWKKEVLQKHQQQHRRESTDKAKSQDALVEPPLPSTTQSGSKDVSSDGLLQKTESLTTREKLTYKEPVTALDHYVIAVDNERQGKLGKALESYRRAFKLDADIDFTYKKHFQSASLPAMEFAEQESRPLKEHDEFKHIIPIGKEYIPPKIVDTEMGRDPLFDLLEQFRNDEESLDYIPRVDYKPVYIAKLPSEIMLQILKYLILHSLSSVPYFALVCKKFFLLSRDPSIWQYGCVQLFKRPNMTLEQSKAVQTEHVYRQFAGNWLQMLIDRPRIRFDGVYISTCHYTRPGASDTTWAYQPVHFVTYYRYLRFYPDGTILKHVTTEEPKYVVKLLHRGFSRKQVFHGFFEQNGDDHIFIRMRDPTLPKEGFYLKLKIKATHRGKHNKLVWDKYYSTSTYGREYDYSFEDIDDVNEESYKYHEYDLKLLKSYFFSPVKSYKVDYATEAVSLFGDITPEAAS